MKDWVSITQRRKLTFTVAPPYMKGWSSDEKDISAEQWIKILILQEWKV